MYDLAILGSGPAGMTAALYAARKNLSTVMIADKVGGQMMLTTGIENWIGTRQTTGFDLTRRFEEHVTSFENLDRRVGETVTTLEKPGEGGFRITTGSGSVYEALAVIVATGKKSRPLDVPGETELVGRGISYCATCDAPVYSGRDVAVVGGGNSAAQAAIDLIPIARSVTVINTEPDWQAEPVLVDKILKAPHVQILFGWRVVRVNGERRVSGLIVENPVTHETRDLPVQGIFVEIGLTPNSDFLHGFLELNRDGEVVIDCISRTSVPGVFAAGDVTTVPAKQIVVAAGEGAKAALAAYDYLVMSSFWSGRATRSAMPDAKE